MVTGRLSGFLSAQEVGPGVGHLLWHLSYSFRSHIPIFCLACLSCLEAVPEGLKRKVDSEQRLSDVMSSHRISIGLRRTFGKSLKQGPPIAVMTALFLILLLLLLATLSSLGLAF